MNTIKISLKGLHEQEDKLIRALSSTFELNFDVERYKAVYNGQIEEGLKIIFFDSLSYKRVRVLDDIFRALFNSYGCAYVMLDHFNGCIKDYLYNNGCGVPSERPQENKLKVMG